MMERFLLAMLRYVQEALVKENKPAQQCPVTSSGGDRLCLGGPMGKSQRTKGENHPTVPSTTKKDMLDTYVQCGKRGEGPFAAVNRTCAVELEKRNKGLATRCPAASKERLLSPQQKRLKGEEPGAQLDRSA